MADEPKEVPLKNILGARDAQGEGEGEGTAAARERSAYAEARKASLYAEGVRSRYAEGVRSVYAEGVGARSVYAEGVPGPLTDKTALTAVNVARAQIRSLSKLARLHHRLGRIADYLGAKK